MVYFLSSITSFNEWGEGTQIEPAVRKSVIDREYKDYGDDPYTFMNMTLKYVAEYQFSLSSPDEL